MIEVGVYGATGYMGGEALRVLNEHPEVKVVWATSRNEKPIEYSHPNLYGSGITLVKPEKVKPCDAVFFATPTGNAMELVPELIKNDTKIIDLGADFRLRDREEWEQVYSKKHLCWELAKEAVYGIPELHRPDIKKARIIANPGCLSSAAILGLAPLIKEQLVDNEKIVIDGLSGTAGAGAELDKSMHHPEIGNNLVSYNVVNHRHSYEIEQELSSLSKTHVTVNLTPTYVPITRGILAICNCFPNRKVNRQELLRLYQTFYKDEFFVRVFDRPKETNVNWQYLPYPWVSSVSGTNFCQIGLDVDQKRNRIVVFSVLDSLGKGGAHVGVQNLNLMFNLDEKTGLERFGMHPN